MSMAHYTLSLPTFSLFFHSFVLPSYLSSFITPSLSLLWKCLQMQIVNCKSSLWSRFPNYKSHNSDHNLQIVWILSNNISQIASVLSLIKISKLHEFYLWSRFPNCKKFVMDQVSEIGRVLCHQVFQIPSVLSYLHSTYLQILGIARLLCLW